MARSSMGEPIRLDGRSLTPEAVVAIARDQREVALADQARAAVELSRARVETVLDSGEAVYGVTTGFGRLVDERIDRRDLRRLQTNLVRSHAAGVGDAPEVVAVAAHAVEDLERHAVLVGDVRRLDALHEQLHLVAAAQVGAEAAVH
ncbi:MAG: aromatic amino acid lyase, partial [Halobacteriota archaeon]